MSDNLRRYRAIRTALTQCYEGKPKGNVARHVNTLAALISGIVGSASTQLPKIAGKVPDGNKPESRVKRFARWLSNEQIETDLYFLPVAQALLAQLGLQTLVLVIDGRVVGRGCVALMVNVVYQGRALPVAWTVVRGKKGHFPETAPIALVEAVQPLVPQGAQVVLLGAGEFDGGELQKTLQAENWSSVCRTASSITVVWQGESFRCGALEGQLSAGEYLALPEVLFTHERYGPVMLICWWATGYQEPIYWVTNMTSAEDACDLYRKRFRIEPFFSDQKSRGFHLPKSHLSDAKRLSRLLMAACLAYIWIVYVGALCLKDGWTKVIHRSHRCDLNLFQLGLRLLEHFLNEGFRIPVAFHMLT